MRFLSGRLFTILGILSLAACSISPRIFANAQDDLAQELGVDRSDYGNLFPVDYYADVLHPGATITEVHAMIQGYEQVYGCPSGAEVYYYFSTRDDTAIRFKVYYDDDLQQYIDLVSEDWNERGIDVTDCLLGRFGD